MYFKGLLYEALNMKTFLQEQQAQGQQVTMTSLRSDHVTSTTTPVPIPPSMLPPRVGGISYHNVDTNLYHEREKTQVTPRKNTKKYEN